MPVRVSPTETNPTHHISLRGRDGKTIGLIMCDEKGNPTWSGFRRMAVERTSLKTTSGNNTYADLEYPYSPIVQDDWSGGRGNLDFERDSSRFYDSLRLRTGLANKAFLGPQEQLSTGNRDHNSNVPGNVVWHKLLDTQAYLSKRFEASATYTATKVWLLARRRGTPADLTIAIHDDDAGSIGTLVTSITVASTRLEDILSEWLNETISAALTASNYYWIKVYSASTDTETDHWQVAVSDTSGTTKFSEDGSTWTSASYDLYYRLTDAASDKSVIFFDYLEQHYMVVSGATGAPSLYIAGDRGAADSNTGQLTKLIDATKAWDTDEHVGKVVLIIGGPGKTEAQRWRTVVSNTATALTLDEAWTVEHTTSTEYVLFGDEWTEITGHGLTAPVTDVLVTTKNMVLFAQGDTVAIRRMREYNNSGTWTRQFADDGTNKAQFLAYKPQAAKIVKGNSDDVGDGTGDASVAYADPVAWATASHTFASTTDVGEKAIPMTGLVTYPDDSGNEAVWVGKEDIAWIVPGSGNPYPFVLDEMRALKSDKNFRAALKHNVYLLFSLGVKLERWYAGNLDDVGPDLGEGLPIDRQGAIIALLGYPGKFFGAVDGGSSGYSSLMVRDNAGWHEHYRAPLGQRIRALSYQVVPGTTPDRLWMYVGNDVVYLPFPSETTNELEDENYLYTHEGALVLSRMHAGMFDVQKLARFVKLWTEDLVEDETWLELDYRLDDETTWTPFDDVLKDSPQSTLDLGIVPLYGMGGKRYQLRVRFYTRDATKTPLLLAVIIEAVIRIGVKHIRPVTFRLGDGDKCLTPNEFDDFPDAMTKLAILDNLADDTSNTMVLMRSVSPLYDGRMVFLNPIDVTQVQVRHDPNNDHAANVYVCTTTVQDA